MDATGRLRRGLDGGGEGNRLLIERRRDGFGVVLLFSVRLVCADICVFVFFFCPDRLGWSGYLCQMVFALCSVPHIHPCGSLSLHTRRAVPLPRET